MDCRIKYSTEGGRARCIQKLFIWRDVSNRRRFFLGLTFHKSCKFFLKRGRPRRLVHLPLTNSNVLREEKQHQHSVLKKKRKKRKKGKQARVDKVHHTETSLKRKHKV